MATDAEAEQDAFDEFLSQDQARAEPELVEPTPTVDATLALGRLVESAQRQEQLLGKVCSLLVGMDDKIGRITESQERMEASMLQSAAQSPQPPGSASAGQRPSAPSRGSLVLPPGKSGSFSGGTGSASAAAPAGAGGSFTSGAASAAAAAEAAKNVAAERARVEEEARRREEELARRREEEEQRKREEAERQRQEEERRKEQERARKANLEKKTGSLMSNLISGSGSSSLFGEEEPKRASKGGLFDDD